MKRTINILVPIDFSTCSENALEFAIQLADKIKANLLLLNVPHLDISKMESPISASLEVEEKIGYSKKRIVEVFNKAVESVHTTLEEVPSFLINIEIGKVEVTICEVAERNKVDYIVMGTQGENSTFDKYLGSVASNVLKKSPCPVIVIPNKSRFAKKAVIAYATDFSDADPFEIWKTIKLFEPFKPNIKCVHFNQKQENNDSKIKKLELYFSETAPELKVDFYDLQVKDKVKDMNDFIDDHNINMLVMYKPKRTFFESIFHVSYTQKMAKHTSIPLLVLMENN
jgi:nucleotide-binding universal stress UspA family protein